LVAGEYTIAVEVETIAAHRLDRLLWIAAPARVAAAAYAEEVFNVKQRHNAIVVEIQVAMFAHFARGCG
jgi:hypothetical protein